MCQTPRLVAAGARRRRARPLAPRALGKAKLEEAIALTRAVLEVPADYRIGIVPASDTGAVEMALWSLLGQRGVDLLAWESSAPAGSATWSSSSSSPMSAASRPIWRLAGSGRRRFRPRRGVHLERHDLRRAAAGWRLHCGEARGLTICDATSAAFAQRLPFDKLDVVTFSWQKVLGGEGAHGVLILSPRAVARLESYQPAWPLPKIFRLTSGGKLIEGIFKGETINTPSMLCVEDYLDALRWARRLGGLAALLARAERNFAVIDRFVAGSSWARHLAADPATRSNTSVCLTVGDADVLRLDQAAQAAFAKGLAGLLETEGVAFDIAAYRDAPPGLRIWAGATVETADLEALMPWLDWAFATRKAALTSAA